MSPETPLPGRRASVWSVGDLVRAVADLIGGGIGACVVRGELAAFSRAPSGHCYFTLKDADGGASLRCAMFRRAAGLLDFQPGDGQVVDLRGRIAIYEPRGELQFVAESMQRSGAGALYEQFVRTRARLAAEGLFADARKRPVPGFPRRVGVVTSLGGAALHDVATTLQRRSPHVELLIYPSPVQGADAPAALCAAIASAGRRDEVDVLIVARGGGSLEDLWAFNDERVVRAIAAAPMPVICGVGHETDVTLADLVADLRAATPTAAAELAAPATRAALLGLDAFAESMRRRVTHRLDVEAQRLDRAGLRLARPADALLARRHALELLENRAVGAVARALQRQHSGLGALESRLGRSALQRSERAAAALDTLDARLARATMQRSERAVARLDAVGARFARAAVQRSERARASLDALAGRLEALDPARVLARGYARLTDHTGAAITSVARVQPGQPFRAVLVDGAFDARVAGGEPAAATPPRSSARAARDAATPDLFTGRA